MPCAGAGGELLAVRLHDTLFLQAMQGDGDCVGSMSSSSWSSSMRVHLGSWSSRSSCSTTTCWVPSSWRGSIGCPGMGRNVLSFRAGPGAATIRAGASLLVVGISGTLCRLAVVEGDGEVVKRTAARWRARTRRLCARARRRGALRARARLARDRRSRGLARVRARGRRARGVIAATGATVRLLRASVGARG